MDEELDASLTYWDVYVRQGPEMVPVTEETARRMEAEARKGSRELTEFRDVHGDRFLVRPADVASLAESTPDGRARANRLRALMERQAELDAM